MTACLLHFATQEQFIKAQGPKRFSTATSHRKESPKLKELHSSQSGALPLSVLVPK